MSASEMSLYEVIESLPPKHGARAEFSALLARIPPCVCGEPTLGVVHRADGPCYLPEQAPPAAAVSASGHFEVLRELSATLIGRSQERHAAIEWALERIEAQPAAAVPAANVTPMRQPRTDLVRLVESINAAVYANGDGLSVTEAIGALELAKLELLKEQEQ